MEGAEVYYPAYLSEPLRGRVFFGRCPKDPEEVNHLLNTCGVTHFINMKPLTDRVTKTGLPAASWYQCFWERKGSDLKAPTLLRYPIMGKDSKRNDRITWYIASALRIATETGPEAVVFIHNDTGLQEEALLGFMLSEVLQRNCIPDVDAWIAAHENAQGVLFADEDRQVLRDAIARHRAAGKQPMLQWLTSAKKKQKTEPTL